MKLKFAAFISILFLPIFIFVPVIFAQTLRSGELVVLSAGETVDRDYFAAGESVSLEGTVNGDAYLAGGNIIVSGTVNGDLIAAGGNLTIDGTVNGNIRVAGGSVNLNGKVARNATAAGGNVIFSNSSHVSGSAVAAGGNISLMGPINKGVTIGGGQVTLSNEVGGDITAGVGQLSLGSQARINGNVVYWSEDKANINSEASVSGTVTQNIPRKVVKDEGKSAIAKPLSVVSLFSFLTALVFGSLLLRFMPGYVQKTTEVVSQSPFLSFGIGLLVAAVTPFIVLLLLITLLGIPFAILWVFFIIFDFWLAKIFISLVLGNYILGYFNKKQYSQYLALVVGLVIYYLITLIPILGWIIGLLAGLTGLGAIVIAKRRIYLDLRQKKLL